MADGQTAGHSETSFQNWSRDLNAPELEFMNARMMMNYRPSPRRRSFPKAEPA
jgi:hypothetical protein